jgi:hypothetical protein
LDCTRRTAALWSLAVFASQDFTLPASDAADAVHRFHPPPSEPTNLVRERCIETGSGTGSREIVRASKGFNGVRVREYSRAGTGSCNCNSPFNEGLRVV